MITMMEKLPEELKEVKDFLKADKGQETKDYKCKKCCNVFSKQNELKEHIKKNQRVIKQ